MPKIYPQGRRQHMHGREIYVETAEIRWITPDVAHRGEKYRPGVIGRSDAPDKRKLRRMKQRFGLTELWRIENIATNY